MSKKFRLCIIFILILIVIPVWFLIGDYANASGGDFNIETANPKYGKTWIASITCRTSNGGTVTTGGTGSAGAVREAVNNAIRQRGLPFRTFNNAILRSEGGTGGNYRWDDNGAPHLPTLRAVCKILGYIDYVSSTCLDEERSGRYPNGKCNYHSPGDNYLSRFVGAYSSPQCSDGLDNDNDGLIDYPQDPGCASRQDDDEYNMSPAPVLEAFCLAHPMTGNVNDIIDFKAHVSGGTGNYTYNWSGACSASSSTDCYKSFTNPGTYTAILMVNSGSQSKTTTCSAKINQLCQTHFYKACSNGDSYWYNSCGVKEDKFEDCGSSACSNGQCQNNVNTACNVNSDCGVNSFTGNPFCQDNKVYANFKSYFCNNPGTTQSFCSSSITQQLLQACGTNQVCNNGGCTTPSINCASDAECGTNSFSGNSFCQGDSVYRNFITYSCNNPGTTQSFCSSSIAPQLKSNCLGNQTCSNGQCQNQNVNIACNSNYNCGADGYIGSLYCQGGDVYQNYKTYTCNNPGTINSSCSSSTSSQLKSNCSGNQTCSNGQCQNQNVNIACNSNSACGTSGYVDSPYCQGNNVYQNYRTYTCNNPGTTYSSCSSSTAVQLQNTCSGNQTCANGYCSSQQSYITVQTNQATNTYNNQATLNGYFSGTNINNINYVWFQWGTTTSYSNNGYETNHQAINYTGPFSQNIAGLSPGVVYYFKAVAQSYNGQIVYGQDMTFRLGQVLGATDVSTGLTNNFLTDSLFLPLMVALAGVWLFKSKILNLLKFGGWANSPDKKLKTKIVEIKERENLN